MKRYLIPILVIFAVASGLLLGCGAETKPTPTKNAASVPIMTQDEVCALVYNYLQNEAASMTHYAHRMSLLEALGIARPSCSATYQGNGKWRVRALGYEDVAYNYDGRWNLYEASETIEPANDQATALLLYIQRWTK